MSFKKAANDKLNSVRLIKRTLSIALATTMAMSFGSIFMFTNSDKVSARYCAGQLESQTRLKMLMMGENKLIKPGHYMNVKATKAVNSQTYSVNISFKIPGHNINTLSATLSRKNGDLILDQKLSSESPTITATIGAQDDYEVVVNKTNSAGEKNFLCKAKFSIVNNALNSSNNFKKANILNNAGAVLSAKGLKYKLVKANRNYLTSFQFPCNLIPYDAKTIKIVFFKTEAERGGQPVNITNSLYDYSWQHGLENSGGDFNFYTNVDAIPDQKEHIYEAHFYKNEVKSENFICKATDIAITCPYSSFEQNKAIIGSISPKNNLLLNKSKNKQQLKKNRQLKKKHQLKKKYRLKKKNQLKKKLQLKKNRQLKNTRIMIKICTNGM